MSLPTLPNHPIVEAILDIFTTLPESVTFGALSSIHELVKADYPIAERRFESIIGNLNSETPQVSRVPLDAIRFKSADGKRVFQARSDGYSYNLLERYSGWDAFYSEAKRLWAIYSGMLKPTKITSVGIRYMNRILLPIKAGENFQEYLRTMPDIPENLPRHLGAFALKMSVPIDEEGMTMVNITEVLDPRQDTPGTIAIVLDNHVKRDGEIGADEIDSVFAELREIKNDTFENCLTEKVINLFK